MVVKPSEYISSCVFFEKQKERCVRVDPEKVMYRDYEDIEEKDFDETRSPLRLIF